MGLIDLQSISNITLPCQQLSLMPPYDRCHCLIAVGVYQLLLLVSDQALISDITRLFFQALDFRLGAQTSTFQVDNHQESSSLVPILRLPQHSLQQTLDLALTRPLPPLTWGEYMHYAAFPSKRESLNINLFGVFICPLIAIQDSCEFSLHRKPCVACSVGFRNY